MREASPYPPLELSFPHPVPPKSLLVPKCIPALRGGWWEELHVGAELGVQLIIMASQPGLG